MTLYKIYFIIYLTMKHNTNNIGENKMAEIIQIDSLRNNHIENRVNEVINELIKVRELFENAEEYATDILIEADRKLGKITTESMDLVLDRYYS